MALGWSLRLDPNGYLLLGVPLTILFQIGVRQSPLRALWVRKAPPLRYGWVGAVVAVILAILPVYTLVRFLRAYQWVEATWALSATGGALAASYCLTLFNGKTGRSLLLVLATGGSVGFVLLLLAWSARKQPEPRPLEALRWFLLYFPVLFVLEEVTFRGALDSHVHHRGDLWGWLSALLVSGLWGIWHLPVVRNPGVETVVGLLVLHTLVGVPLSLGWRHSGNLAVPGFTHALLDAVRNALLPRMGM